MFGFLQKMEGLGFQHLVVALARAVIKLQTIVLTFIDRKMMRMMMMVMMTVIVIMTRMMAMIVMMITVMVIMMMMMAMIVIMRRRVLVVRNSVFNSIHIKHNKCENCVQI